MTSISEPIMVFELLGVATDDPEILGLFAVDRASDPLLQDADELHHRSKRCAQLVGGGAIRTGP